MLILAGGAGVIAQAVLGWSMWRRIGDLEWQHAANQKTVQDAKLELDHVLDSEHKLRQALAARKAAVAPARPQDQKANPRSALHNVDAALENSEARALLLRQQRWEIAKNYRALLAKLGLPREIEAKLIDLIAQRQIAKSDATSAAVDAGIVAGKGRSGQYEQAVASAQKDIDGAIQQLLGDKGLTTYKHYEETFAVRQLVTPVQNELSYTQTPLTDAQVDQLVEAWYTAQPNRVRGDPSGDRADAGAGLDGPRRSAVVPFEAYQLAKQILAPEQLEAVEEIVRTQQATRRLSMLKRRDSGT